MDIKKAEFLMSNTRFEFLPNDNIPEYAFIGRSNVGKSSLINMLVQRRGLAKTSSVPGKTVAINAPQCSEQAKYIVGATVNGTRHDRPWFSHDDIARGATIVLNMSERHTLWGSNASATPPSAASCPQP